jgi:hypothetical protein
VEYPWTSGQCCVQTTIPNPFWTSASPVFCDLNQNIIVLNLGKGSTIGIRNNLLTNAINGEIPESISSLKFLQTL